MVFEFSFIIILLFLKIKYSRIMDNEIANLKEIIEKLSEDAEFDY